MQPVLTSPGSAPTPVNSSSDPQTGVPRQSHRRPLLPIERQHQDASFRSERSPADLELEAIEAEAAMQVSGWTAHG